MLEFEWDVEKAAINHRKHKVSFDEAVSAFADTLSLTIPDPEHTEGEFRYLLLGMTSKSQLVVVSYTERNERIRLISARIATSRERKNYESSN